MKHEFIPYEEAYELRKLGFNEPSIATYGGHLNNKWILTINSDYYKHHKYHESVKACTAPLYQQVFRWFRDEYNLKFHIIEDKWNHWCYPKILIPETNDYEEMGISYPTYKEAELECLKKLIEIVKSLKKNE